jgi:hypothetical protein
MNGKILSSTKVGHTRVKGKWDECKKVSLYYYLIGFD